MLLCYSSTQLLGDALMRPWRYIDVSVRSCDQSLPERTLDLEIEHVQYTCHVGSSVHQQPRTNRQQLELVCHEYKTAASNSNSFQDVCNQDVYHEHKAVASNSASLGSRLRICRYIECYLYFGCGHRPIKLAVKLQLLLS